jgi:hypothetical protein
MATIHHTRYVNPINMSDRYYNYNNVMNPVFHPRLDNLLPARSTMARRDALCGAVENTIVSFRVLYTRWEPDSHGGHRFYSYGWRTGDMTMSQHALNRTFETLNALRNHPFDVFFEIQHN